ncbi:very long chain fatty acid elongase 7-like [Halichondria panicea]|uniref:very long chain fatty acid elongase 7-like n=1 Tax=Halichondria panicea TaxID=6063 RepID=UPI00312B91E9
MGDKLECIGQVVRIFATSRSAPIVGLYLLLVCLSPLLRRLLPAFQLRRALILHNFVCWILSVYSLATLVFGLWEVGDIFLMEHTEGWLRHGLFVYWISKFVELLDTVYMILRHKSRQISFLHVWHHSTITLLADWAYTRSSWPALTPILALNSAVHVFMYGYYFLTALHPLHDFTWKKRITQFQMVQFLIGISQAVYGYLYRGFCIYSIGYGAAMLGLFGNYYYYAFIRKKPQKKEQ